jgi:signal transduction histidine kinase/CheY-like chemotaxis protein
MSARQRILALVAAIALPVFGIAILAPRALTHMLDEAGYLPHAHCYLLQSDLISLHAVSDLLIGLAYVAISVTLAFLVYRARARIPFHWMVLAFGAFIVACGMTHFMEVYTLWHPTYWLSGDVKVLTAIASVGTALALPPLVPRILGLIEAEHIAAARQVALVESDQLLEAERAARSKAEQADRAKDQFLAMISHELRAPLSPILAWTRMLRDGLLTPEQSQRAFEVVERSARTQAQLIEDLLDISRIVEGKVRLQVRPVALAEVVQRSIESLGTAADAKGIRLQAVLDTTVPPIAGDADRLQQIAWNLLSNAVKFTPKGGRVHVTLERVNSHVELSVTDTGIGITADQLPHLFERFWQVDLTPTRAHSGLGLGLSIARQLTELHGGTITGESGGEGQGATFTVKLPTIPFMRTAGEEVRRHPILGEPSAAVPLAELRDVRVLLVDDDPESNEAARVVLDHRGAEVRVAASAAQALEIMQRWTPDVLVTDIGMPGEDGYALLRRVRAQPGAVAHVPAIALTAYASVDDRVRVLSSGFQLHLAKPADLGEMTAAIASLAATSRRATT